MSKQSLTLKHSDIISTSVKDIQVEGFSIASIYSLIFVTTLKQE